MRKRVRTEGIIGVGNGMAFLLVLLVGMVFGAPSVWASANHVKGTFLGECDGKEYYKTFHKTYSTVVERECKDGREYDTTRQYYKGDNGDTCYVEKIINARSCGDSSADIVEEIIWDLIAIKAAEEEKKRVASLERSRSRQIERNYGFTKPRKKKRLETLSSAGGLSSYEPSDLPAWDFDFSVQGSAKKSEMELTPSLGRESDVKSLAFNFGATRNDFLLHSQLYITSLEGSGPEEGQDTDTYGLLLMPGYQLLDEEKHGLTLLVYGFLELSSNDYGDGGKQTRYVPGFGFTVGKMTPAGEFKFSNLFSHDRNSDGDIEITGDEYLNMNTVTFTYVLPLTESLLFSTNLDYMKILDMPDGLEDSSTNISAALNYYGWENYTVGLSYIDSLDGYEERGVTLTVGYLW